MRFRLETVNAPVLLVPLSLPFQDAGAVFGFVSRHANDAGVECQERRQLVPKKLLPTSPPPNALN